MTSVDLREIYCPYCAEPQEVMVDASELLQTRELSITYTEDCQICCRPMVCHMALRDPECGDFFDSDSADIDYSDIVFTVSTETE